MKKEDREKIHRKYGKHCAYCGKKIAYKDMQVDHIKSKHNGGSDDMSNLNPSCRRCNHYKRAKNLEGFRKYIKTLHKRIAENYIVKVGLDYGIVELKPFDGKFYFER